MNEVAFVEERQGSWIRLSQLCDLASNSLSRLNSNEFTEFVRLYRECSTDLAKVRTQSGNLELIEYLNQLVSRAYAILYRGIPGRFAEGLAYIFKGFAQAVRRQRLWVFLSLFVFLFGGVFGYGLLKSDESNLNKFVPVSMQDVFEHWKSGKHLETSASDKLTMTSYYAFNNPQVSLITISQGFVTGGILSAKILFDNGLLLGMLVQQTGTTNTTGFLISSILPHGATEIQGIIIAGAAGFLMGWSFLCPGQKTRIASLKEAMKDGFFLFVGGIMMMFMAAPIEGFFSFNPKIPQSLKAIVGIIFILAWVAYYVQVGREEQPSSAPNLS